MREVVKAHNMCYRSRSYKLKFLVKLVVQLRQLCIDLDHIFSRISKEISTKEEEMNRIIYDSSLWG